MIASFRCSMSPRRCQAVATSSSRQYASSEPSNRTSSARRRNPNPKMGGHGASAQSSMTQDNNRKTREGEKLQNTHLTRPYPLAWIRAAYVKALGCTCCRCMSRSKSSACCACPALAHAFMAELKHTTLGRNLSKQSGKHVYTIVLWVDEIHFAPPTNKQMVPHGFKVVQDFVHPQYADSRHL